MGEFLRFTLKLSQGRSPAHLILAGTVTLLGHPEPEATPGDTRAGLLLLVPPVFTRNLQFYTCHGEFSGSFPPRRRHGFWVSVIVYTRAVFIGN